MTVQATNDAAILTTLQSAPNTRKDASNESSDRFLKLLVTQLKNQDPLSPMDNAQVTTQMAQINTVEGINKLNTTLTSMATDANANQTVQAASLVGRQVLAEGDRLSLIGGQAAGGYALTAAAESLTLSIKSAAGEMVYSGALGPQAAGMHVFAWDGIASNGQKAAAGSYTFEVTARNGTTNTAAQPLLLGRVDGITPGANGAKLTLGSYGEFSIASVKHIL